ncbi:DUF551 domain-containing protein [Raoultella ornithinolytica]|uniref:DUF551 domain-containing protein n=1 Tax=Raoultella ornithinolytica TaxID=54291 RepID=UPI00255AB042|nr:DUF551 domain-containing protein [Raoultella ornithinolytica]MDL4584204.1 DUF551 domain-containing protein [Raoultella ornithinolytica]
MTSKLTREELRKRAKENINNLRFASKQRAFESARKEILADLQLAEYALEAMESEPYGFTEGERFGMVLEPRQWPAPKDGEPQLHIKEQPGPDIDTLRHAFETEEREETGGFNLHKSGIDYVDKSTQAQWEAWLVCRAAMLQAGISAVIPDGYVMVPKEPTQAMCAAFNDSDYGRKSLRERYVAMLAAAAHDTPALNSVQSVATVPGKWVPVSERMPETDGNYWGWWSESKRQGPVWFIKSELQAQFQSHEITHWMPLPAAPQEVKGES